MPTQISGSTGVSKVQDGVIAQADLAANVAGNGPAFSAYQSVVQSVSSTLSKLIFQTEEFDTNANYDPVLSRFTPSTPGYYQINAAWQSSGVTAGCVLVLRKNGVDFRYGTCANTSLATPLVAISTLVYLNGTTDYLEVFAGQTTTLNTAATNLTTFFQGFLARAA